MAVLNPMALVNRGVDLVKPGAAITAPDTLSEGARGDNAFAKTLHQEMQNGQTSNTANSPSVLNKPVKSATSTPPDTTAAAHKHGERSASEAQENNASEDMSANVELNETLPLPQSDKLSSEREDTDERLSALGHDEDRASLVSALPFSPWMQSMMAMRQGGESTPPTTDDTRDASRAMSDPVLSSKDQQAAILNSQDASAPSAVKTQTPFVLGEHGGGHSANALPAMLSALEAAKANALDERGQLKTAMNETAMAAEAVASAIANATLTNTASTNLQTLPDVSQIMRANISTPFANQERWQTAINQQVVNMVSQGDELASLTLSPPDLGPVQVVLKIDNQSVDTVFVSDHPHVRQALEDGLHDLRERMQSQGLQLGQTFVGDGQQARQHFTDRQTPFPLSEVAASVEGEEASPILPPVVNRRLVLGGVDTFV